MKTIITISILLIISFLSGKLNAQTPDEIDYLKLNLPEKGHNKYIDSVKTYNNEFDWLFSHLFIFYKEYVSSQDASSCSFTPSCSEYAIMAVKKQGLILGVINFWDRFSRCNGMSPEYYEIDENVGLLIDPVRDWTYEKK